MAFGVIDSKFINQKWTSSGEKNFIFYWGLTGALYGNEKGKL